MLIQTPRVTRCHPLACLRESALKIVSWIKSAVIEYRCGLPCKHCCRSEGSLAASSERRCNHCHKISFLGRPGFEAGWCPYCSVTSSRTMSTVEVRYSRIHLQPKDDCYSLTKSSKPSRVPLNSGLQLVLLVSSQKMVMRTFVAFHDDPDRRANTTVDEPQWEQLRSHLEVFRGQQSNCMSRC